VLSSFSPDKQKGREANAVMSEVITTAAMLTDSLILNIIPAMERSMGLYDEFPYIRFLVTAEDRAHATEHAFEVYGDMDQCLEMTKTLKGKGKDFVVCTRDKKTKRKFLELSK
jgi:hypothetical protein